MRCRNQPGHFHPSTGDTISLSPTAHNSLQQSMLWRVQIASSYLVSLSNMLKKQNKQSNCIFLLRKQKQKLLNLMKQFGRIPESVSSSLFFTAGALLVMPVGMCCNVNIANKGHKMADLACSTQGKETARHTTSDKVTPTQKPPASINLLSFDVVERSP